MAFGHLGQRRADGEIGGDAARHHQGGSSDIGKSRWNSASALAVRSRRISITAA